MTQSLPSWYTNEPFCYLPHEIPDKTYVSDTRNNLAVKHDEGS
jgi:hypothetical protein